MVVNSNVLGHIGMTLKLETMNTGESRNSTNNMNKKQKNLSKLSIVINSR